MYNTEHFAEAESRMVRALRLRSEHSGRAHPTTRRCAANLAMITSSLRAEQLETLRRKTAERKVRARAQHVFETNRINHSPSGLHSNWELGGASRSVLGKASKS